MRLLLIILFMQGFIQSSQGQKVAVVMSGGAAKGLAHIGMLKALEENEIPVDFVAGTSMGGIVAGCYAAGMSPGQIEEIMLSEDLSRWVNGQLEDGYNYFYNKDDVRPSFVRLNLQLDSTFSLNLNTSLANDIALNFALAEKMAQPSAIARLDNVTVTPGVSPARRLCPNCSPLLKIHKGQPTGLLASRGMPCSSH